MIRRDSTLKNAKKTVQFFSDHFYPAYDIPDWEE